MPELPEARTIARRLDSAVAGATLSAATLLRRDMLKTGTPRGLKALAGGTIRHVDTRGKYVVIHLDSARLVLQLGMAGRVRIAVGTEEPEPHTHLRLALADGRAVSYSNVRRIAGGVHLLPPGKEDLGPLAALGPEATEIPAEAFVAAMTGTRRAIKSALLDQSLLAGVGNIYSDEALFRARIRPTRPANRLKRAELLGLHAAVQEVLQQAILAGGSSLKDANPFVDADGQVGFFATQHRVYGRYGRACVTCRTTLTRVTLGGRTSTFCPRCQK